MICEKCKKREATYDSPGDWCDDCWAEWWVSSDLDEGKPDLTDEERAKWKQEVLDGIKADYGEQKNEED